jgi:hypothetical protein
MLVARQFEYSARRPDQWSCVQVDTRHALGARLGASGCSEMQWGNAQPGIVAGHSPEVIGFKSPLGHIARHEAAGDRPAAVVVQVAEGRPVTHWSVLRRLGPHGTLRRPPARRGSVPRPVGRVSLHRRRHLAVDVESDADGRVTEPLLDDLRVARRPSAPASPTSVGDHARTVCVSAVKMNSPVVSSRKATRTSPRPDALSCHE